MSLIDLFIPSYFGMKDEQGNNRCLCLSHIFYVFLGWVGYFYPIHKTYITQTCNKNIEKQQSALIKQSSIF